MTDACLAASPTIGATCEGGAIYIGSLSPGATSGTGTDKYMTTPGGCGEIPAGQIAGGTSVADTYSITDFEPTCSGGTDSLRKCWNNCTVNPYDIPDVVNYPTNDATGQGSTNTDLYYGSVYTAAIVAITATNQGGYHAAARYCDKLSYGGYTDWYLPSCQELNLMYVNKANIPGLDTTGVWYWCSTELVWMSNYTNFASTQRFSDNTQNGSGKYGQENFRCVRRF
jgi:hypothetical protein